jgi:hypothetical protein
VCALLAAGACRGAVLREVAERHRAPQGRLSPLVVGTPRPSTAQRHAGRNATPPRGLRRAPPRAAARAPPLGLPASRRPPCTPDALAAARPSRVAGRPLPARQRRRGSVWPRAGRHVGQSRGG